MNQRGSTSMFKYSPLDPTVDSIRLVVLEPGNPPNEIRCHIRHVTFRARPKYQAISYTRGDHPANKELSIDGKSFFVGPNLYDALFYLRDIQKECVFWIDAICINQADIHEKNRQISIMPYIYTRAQVVVVWLGCIRQIWIILFSDPEAVIDSQTSTRVLEAMR